MLAQEVIKKTAQKIRKMKNKLYPSRRTQEVQDKIDKKIAQFKKNSGEFAKREPFPFVGGPSWASPAPR